MNKQSQPRSLFFPVLLILVGAFLLLNTLKLLPGSTLDVLLRLWPLLFVVGGLDGLVRREGLTGSVLSIGLGIILLMASFGYLNNSGWQSLLRFWPLIIIAIGLDLIIGRRGRFSTIVALLIGLGMVAVMFWLVISPAANRLTRSQVPVSQALEGRKEARLVINQSAGRLDASSGAAAASLLEGSLSLVQGEQVNWAMLNNKTFEMKSAGNQVWVFTSFAAQSRWDLKLSGAIPLDLEVETAAGEQVLDLRGLQIRELDVQLAVGEMHVILPASSSLNGSLECAVCQMLIEVPKGTAVRFTTETALASLSVPEGYLRDGKQVSSPAAASASQVMELRLSQPVGSILIREIP